MDKIKKNIRKIVPPIVISLFKKKNKYGFWGNHDNWEKAVKDSNGYDSPIIFEKIKNSALKVKEGSAVAERDGITFDTKQYSWPVIAMLLLSASRNDNDLDILDFGGSLGSSYFQNIEFLKYIKKLNWTIVEQKNIYDYGKRYFENDKLSFHESLEEALKKIKPQTFLAGSSIQYIEKPYELLEKVIKNKFELIIFDRTPFFNDKEVIAVQKVSPRIYDSSYPAWVFNINKFTEFFKDNEYGIIAECEQGKMSYNGKEDIITLKHLTFIKK